MVFVVLSLKTTLRLMMLNLWRSIITILGKSLASGLHSVKVPLNASFKSKPTFPAISIVVLALLTFSVKIYLIIF
jgi:hypothetical protein